MRCCVRLFMLMLAKVLTTLLDPVFLIVTLNKTLSLSLSLSVCGLSFSLALTSAVNHFASGRAPSFLKRFVAGGVSIALEKSATAVRPLACGDPLRRLVGKCFCVAGKEEISQSFSGRNYGVGCPGGVEVVAHSLRDCLQTKQRFAACSVKDSFAMR